MGRRGDAPGEFLLDLLHVVSRNVQALVGAVLGLGLEAHRGVVAGIGENRRVSARLSWWFGMYSRATSVGRFLLHGHTQLSNQPPLIELAILTS